MNGFNSANKPLKILLLKLIHHGARAHTGVSAG